MEITEDEIITTFNNLLGFEGFEAEMHGNLVLWVRGRNGDFRIDACVSRGRTPVEWSIEIGVETLTSREFSGSLSDLEEKLKMFIFIEKMKKL